MKVIKLHEVRYFKGEDTRLLSKHLHSDSAFQVANRFINNLKHKMNEQGAQVVVSITHSSEEELLLDLVSREDGSLNEGVRVSLVQQVDPNWDYPQHDDPRESGSGYMTTAGRRHY